MLQKTPILVGINHPHRLHVGIDNHRPHKFHPALFQVFRYLIRQRRTDLIFFINNLIFCPLPDIIREASKFSLYLPEYTGIIDRGADFQTVSDNPWILTEFIYFILIVGAHFLQVKPVKRLPKRLPLIQYTFPGQRSEERRVGKECRL